MVLTTANRASQMAGTLAVVEPGSPERGAAAILVTAPAAVAVPGLR